MDTLTKESARKLIEQHQIPFNDFIRAFGDKDHYSIQEAMQWLGY